jgi:hypothetical protein
MYIYTVMTYDLTVFEITLDTELGRCIGYTQLLISAINKSYLCCEGHSLAEFVLLLPLNKIRI